MSRPTRNASKTVCTIWLKSNSGNGYNGLGASTSFEQKVFLASYNYGGSTQFSDTQGVMFTPKASYWFEENDSFTPDVGDYIVVGDYSTVSNPNDANADVIRNANLHDCSLLNQPDDWELVT